GERRAGEGGGAKRQDVDALAAVGEAFAVALVLLDVGEEVVGGEDRLCPLEVRVAGQDDVAVSLGGVEQRRLQVEQKTVHPIDGVARPQPDVGDDLVVAAAAGVQLAADVAEFLDEGAFDVRVDVFEFDGEGEVAALDAAGDLVEGGDDLVRLVGGEEA